MLQIISRPIYIQPTYTLHCNHVPAQQGGWTGKTSLESITDLSISCGALGFIRRMDSELKYAPPARQGICHSRPLSVAPQAIAASDFWPVATIFATGSAISTSSAHITPPCDTVFYKPLADWQCNMLPLKNKFTVSSRGVYHWRSHYSYLIGAYTPLAFTVTFLLSGITGGVLCHEKQVSHHSYEWWLEVQCQMACCRIIRFWKTTDEITRSFPI